MTKALTLGFAAALLLGSSQAAQATPLVSANSNDNLSPSTPTQSASSGTVSDAESGANFGLVTNGHASASFGVLHAYGSSSTVGWGSSGYSTFSFNTASWRDDFLIDAPGLTGTAGQVTIRFTIDGSLSYSSSGTVTQYSEDQGYAQASYIFSTGSGFSSGQVTQTLNYAGTSGTSFLNVEQVYTLDFIYGVAITDVRLEINARTSTHGEFSSFLSSATADLANTATWGGFSQVLDAGGDPVTNYTFSSSSGANYSQAIPEPGSALLLLASGALFASIRRRRSADSAAA